MIPVPAEVDEDARRRVRERAELIAGRVGLVNRIGAVVAALGVGQYNPLRRDRRQRLDELRTPLGDSLPTHARAKIVRTLDRLELPLIEITEPEQSRDAVLEDENPDRSAGMIQQLAKLCGVSLQSATVLAREGFVREFANGKALGSYAGLTATPYSSDGTEREQGIGKGGNARLRTVMVELAWLWRRYQPDSAQVGWFGERISGKGRRMRKVMVVALARGSC